MIPRATVGFVLLASRHLADAMIDQRRINASGIEEQPGEARPEGEDSALSLRRFADARRRGPSPVQAWGFISFHFGVPVGAALIHPSPIYYYPRPAYYYRPPPSMAAPSQNCRE